MHLLDLFWDPILWPHLKVKQNLNIYSTCKSKGGESDLAQNDKDKQQYLLKTCSLKTSLKVK